MFSLLDIIRNTFMYIGIYRVLVVTILHFYERSHEKPLFVTKRDYVMFIVIALLIWFCVNYSVIQ